MKKAQIRNIIPHFVQDEHSQSLSNRIADLHAQVIERRLNQSNLTLVQKLTVIDQIIENLKSREVKGVIQ
jgi:uncharacterized protein with von Willebrand factor type A (vWA) domain